MVGAICILAWLVRLGFLADLLSRPVLVGYMVSIAVIMIAGQLGKMTRSDVSGDNPVTELLSAARQVGSWHPPTVILSVVVLGLLLAASKWTPRLPGPLMVMAAAAAVVALTGLGDHGVSLIGAVPSGLPFPKLGPSTATTCGCC